MNTDTQNVIVLDSDLCKILDLISLDRAKFQIEIDLVNSKLAGRVQGVLAVIYQQLKLEGEWTLSEDNKSLEKMVKPEKE